MPVQIRLQFVVFFGHFRLFLLALQSSGLAGSDTEKKTSPGVFELREGKRQCYPLKTP